MTTGREGCIQKKKISNRGGGPGGDELHSCQYSPLPPPPLFNLFIPYFHILAGGGAGHCPHISWKDSGYMVFPLPRKGPKIIQR